LKFLATENLIKSEISDIIYIESERERILPLLNKFNTMPPQNYIKTVARTKRRKIMKLTEKSQSVFDYIKANGGKVSIDELATALDRTTRSVNANVTDLSKKNLVTREKVAGEGEDAKDITYAVITPAGAEFVPSEDAE
jgi:DNA-binding MarR family transcriptional regulator